MTNQPSNHVAATPGSETLARVPATVPTNPESALLILLWSRKADHLIEEHRVEDLLRSAWDLALALVAKRTGKPVRQLDLTERQAAEDHAAALGLVPWGLVVARGRCDPTCWSGPEPSDLAARVAQWCRQRLEPSAQTDSTSHEGCVAVDRDLWIRAAELFETQTGDNAADPEGRRVERIEAECDPARRHLPALARLFRSIAPRVAADDAFLLQLPALPYLDYILPINLSPRDRVLWPFLERFWRHAFHTQRFRFAQPQRVARELDQLPGVTSERRVRQLVRVLLVGFPGVPRDDLRDWLESDSSSSTGQESSP